MNSLNTQLKNVYKLSDLTWHALQSNSCPKSPQKGETKTIFNQLNPKAFSISPRTHVKCESVVRCTKVSFKLLSEGTLRSVHTIQFLEPIITQIQRN